MTIVRALAVAALCLNATAASAQTGAANGTNELQAMHDRILQGVAIGDSGALLDLATLKEEGDFQMPIDRAAALDLYQQAADKGERIAREKICMAYLLGEGREKDPAKAAPYCNPLGVTDDPAGLYWAAYDFQYGVTGPADEAQALSLYAQAAQKGSGDAAVVLAKKAVELGKPDMARQWLRRGVYLGSADAMDGLAVMVETGQGAPADTDEAQWLYRNAAQRGNVHAAGKAVPGPELSGFGFMSSKDHPVSFTHTIAAGKSTREEKLDPQTLIRDLAGHFPTSAINGNVSGLSSLECYVTGDHAIDACIVTHEFPLGVGFGATLEALFDGHMVISDTDGQGNPTAHRVLRQTIRWVMAPTKGLTPTSLLTHP